ncbi:RcpC/CpaB family pilus assembly protein [Streptosporangium sp. NBC_01755]|uniref:RcpC/CpaB family pilus assembly protein n=1 Tax=unclassified Streptosporangium TaxID=2632669 RepID=UPI002DDA24BF|nr:MULTISPECIES: RcpC/CpaB family pilus assembly protein [unclassified Streptosporangium]WSA26006.1 RcpC/CpaB family pilus assembly protein [Streptosporangium sp. NBC_01810]WSD02572.1 RcpC/CpaB family pilus assembly protein [Streptosporangium sp. NBC_01755]
MRALRRLLGRRHRLLSALVAALAMGCAVLALRPDTASVIVLTAARDLPGGVLKGTDLTPAALRPGTVPDGALRPGTPFAGKILAGPARRGEPLTDVRLLGPGLLAAHAPGTVATPVRVADPETARLLSPGDVVDVLAAATSTWDGTAPAMTVAEDVTVLATPDEKSERGALVVLATTSAQATELASAQAGGRLSITIGARAR